MAKKKISLTLVGLDGNAFSLMGAFKRQAQREGWSDVEIGIVLDEAMEGDYDHLLATLIDHCEDEGYDDDDDPSYYDRDDDD